MYEQKTQPHEGSVAAFIDSAAEGRKREDAYRLLEVFEKTTGYEAKMWGSSIIGFGSYHYVYPTGHEGDAPLVGFSPRKSSFSIYTAVGDPGLESLLDGLGRHRRGKACLYVNKLADINEEVLRQIILQSMEFLRRTYPSSG